LCFLWIEEAYEVMSEDDFDRLDESIRGILPDGLYHQVTLTLGPGARPFGTAKMGDGNNGKDSTG